MLEEKKEYDPFVSLVASYEKTLGIKRSLTSGPFDLDSVSD